jgi:hypothetical protein
MGIFDKAKDMMGEHPDAVDSGIDKAGDFADEKTGHEHTEQIDRGADALGERLRDLSGPESTPPAPPPSAAPPA